ncbi:MAG TPA: carboxymuconolactone decarboxylase family protein [Syntrophomonas sp.]|jgi:pyruvate dehydrogenase E2 component (dihydrolipoamide acetyltransferase)|nr:carboxymuconolactone decarboxylase family protein [Syntrophomonas sp.]
MVKDPNEILEDMWEGIGKIAEEAPEIYQAFLHTDQAAYVEGELDSKTKQLIALGIALFTRCEYCMTLHTQLALKEGSNRDEILEVIGVATAFGGSPSMSYGVTTVLAAVDAFE